MIYERGVTLVELLVVLVLLGILTGISGVAVATLDRPREAQRVIALQRARAAAVQTGRALRTGDPPVLFLPDGRALGPAVDPLTGAVYATR